MIRDAKWSGLKNCKNDECGSYAKKKNLRGGGGEADKLGQEDKEYADSKGLWSFVNNNMLHVIMHLCSWCQLQALTR